MTENDARQLDAADPLRELRGEFLIPPGPDGRESVYLCGHSLGLQPRAVRGLVEQELQAWAELGVEGHFRGPHPWYRYHEDFAAPLSRLVGAHSDEVVAMNSLTVNLHLMLSTFYQSTPERAGILIDEPTFPSDRYALETLIRCRGLDPGRWLIGTEDVEATLAERGHELAVVLVNPVNFLTGARQDVERIIQLGHEKGCVVGLDLAHAIGNVPMWLHKWDADFAVWCSYKYLNSGPGAVGGCFVHRRHGQNTKLPRLAGWWGNDPATRFRMQLERDFHPITGADGWQLSNPPVLALAPLRASLELFDRAGIDRLREKSLMLTAYLEKSLAGIPGVEMVTPSDPERRGSMLALRIAAGARELHGALEGQGIVCDFREPDVIRVTPAPLYNGYHDVWRFAKEFKQLTTDEHR